MIKRRHRPLFGTVLLALILTGIPAGAGAQGSGSEPAPTSRGVQLEARLVEFPVWVGSQDALAVGLEVENSGGAWAGELEVAVSIFQAVTNRSRLQQTYAGRLGTTLAVDTIPVDGVIEPGQVRRIDVSKPLEELASFRGSTTDRTYPVRVVVRSGGATSNAIDTHMVFFHEPPEKPLQLGLVIPLHSPSIYTDGSRPDLVTNESLEQSISGGPIARILEALVQHPELPVTLAPSGLLLSMLHDMSVGYPRLTDGGVEEVGAEDPRAAAAAFTLARIRDLAARPNTRVIATAYSPVSLPALHEFALQEIATIQISEGRNVLSAEPVGLLRTHPMPGWLLPPFGDVDRPSLTHLQRSGIDSLIVSAHSLRPTDEQFTRALPVRLEGGLGSATGGLAGVETVALVADDGLSAQIARAGRAGTLEARQRFVAETATIHLETPGLVRAVVAVAPNNWTAQGASAHNLLAVLGQAPWIQPTTPDTIRHELAPASGEQMRLNSTETILDQRSALPSDTYFAALGEARRSISTFSNLAPPAAQIGALSRRLLIAASADWWNTQASVARGREFAEAIPVAVAADMNKLWAPAAQTITLTSRTGVIPLSVGSGLSYPVDVVLTLESDKLSFPDGNRIDVSDLQPPNQTIRVRAITESSGTFPLRVLLSTPSGTVLSDSQLTIRSTAYNVVALSITAAAAAFIVGWWLVGLIRRRLTRVLPGGEPTTGPEPEEVPAGGSETVQAPSRQANPEPTGTSKRPSQAG